MSEGKPIEAEVVPEQTQALVVRQEQSVAPSGLFGVTEPAQVVQKASAVATALRDVITKQGLISRIQGKDYPKCEAWTLLGTMLGVFPVLVWSRKVDGGWEARVEARTKDGAIVGAAEAQCLKSEKNWSNRDDFALRSMAQTRATAKCLRMPLGFVMTLGGFEATPAEEMVADHPHKPPQKPPGTTEAPRPPSSPTPTTKTSPTPKSATGLRLKPPTAQTRKWMVDEITREGLTDIAREYFQKVEGRDLLLPNEGLLDLPLKHVPYSRDELRMLITRIRQFANGDPAERAFQPHEDAEDSNPAKPAAESLPKEAIKNPESWRSAIVPLPRKGMKRADYIENPDSLGSLFDLRHGNDEEAQYARQRLWGLVNHYEAKGWTKKDGTVVPPSQDEIEFKKQLEDFKIWWDSNHRGESL